MRYFDDTDKQDVWDSIKYGSTYKIISVEMYVVEDDIIQWCKDNNIKCKRLGVIIEPVKFTPYARFAVRCGANVDDFRRKWGGECSEQSHTA